MRPLPVTALLLQALIGCSQTGTPPLSDPPCTDAQYEAALHDVIDPGPSQLDDQLIDLTPSNPRTIWKDGKVLLVQFTPFTGYAVGENTLPKDIFVSVAPQVRQFCQTVPPDEQEARLHAFLGIPPLDLLPGPRNLVELWADPADVFRPCTDPRIDTTGCQLPFPDDATAEHKAWLSAYFAGSLGPWVQPKYPFTGLGYTYDWCNPNSRIGTSEYVVRAGSTITVDSVTPTATYCAPSDGGR